MSRCFGLVLAAGSSRRFGSDKRLHQLPDGQPLAIATLHNWSLAVGPNGLDALFVVTRGAGSNDEDNVDPLSELIAKANIAVTVLAAKDSALGMGHSLAAAIPLIPAGAIVVGLADMPFVRPATLRRIATRVLGAPATAIVRPSYKGQPGNPVGFGPALRGALADSTGDSGARILVKKAAENRMIIDVPVDDAGVIQDIDRPTDLSDSEI